MGLCLTVLQPLLVNLDGMSKIRHQFLLSQGLSLGRNLNEKSLLDGFPSTNGKVVKLALAFTIFYCF